ncbi:MAG: hypothetical protein ACFB15_01890 [Cyclobacteriaceae bacterium]
MKSFPLLFSLVLIVTLCTSCFRPKAGFFTAESYLKPFHEKLDEPLTIIIDQNIENEFPVGRMDVSNFRHTLRLSLYYTFETSVSNVEFSDTVAEEGITLQLFRIRPDWVVRDRYNSVVVIDGYGWSSTFTEVASLIRYDGIVYRNGEKWLSLDQEVYSETTTFNRRDAPAVFEDGIREFCEDIYRIITAEYPKNS